jgi:hypothetical protein
VLTPAAHSFVRTEHGYTSELMKANNYADGYRDSMAQWLTRWARFPG